MIPPARQRPSTPHCRPQHLIAREVLDHASRRIDVELAGEPEVEAAVRTTIGRAYHASVTFAEAEPHLRRAVASANHARLRRVGDLALPSTVWARSL